MATTKTKKKPKDIKVRDLKPLKDVKGGIPPGPPIMPQGPPVKPVGAPK